MSNIILFTTDENSANGIREASFQEVLDAARIVFCVIYLTKRHQFIACEDLFRGTLSSASVHPREVVKIALLKGAAACLAYHNHPSGVQDQSVADEIITQKLRSALALVDVRLLDHFLGGFQVVLYTTELQEK
jgi:DNA repair protein RadC